jgi:nicotinate phosphoribosyltransferase
MVSGTLAGATSVTGTGTALRTDHYELTMLAAVRTSGVADRPVVFEVFARALPPGRRYGVVAGTGRLADAIRRFRFEPDDLAFLAATGVADAATRKWLAGYRFTGTVLAYEEGETFFAGSPVVTVHASFAEAVLLETLVLSILNHDSAVASAAARMVRAATSVAGPRDRRLIDMGSRRTHDDAAVDAARAAYIAGFSGTSNLEAGRRYGIPTSGTAAHAYTLVHDDEYRAFVAQLRALGVGTTLLVDTFDTPTGLRTAVRAANALGYAGPGAVRIDSGDLAVEARNARAMLDALGATETRIVVSGDLDEYEIAGLEHDPAGRAPIDAYGVGTRLVTGSGHPTAGFVYKLVEVDGMPVEKRSPGKRSVGGAKRAYRLLDREGITVGETLLVRGKPPAGSRPLQQVVVDRGDPRPGAALDAMRAHHRRALDELPPSALGLDPGEPALHTTFDHEEA